VIGAFALFACAPERGEAPKRQLAAREVTDVVARVGGRPVGAVEVAARMRTEGVDAKTALELLIDEETLAQEAERRGVATTPREERAIERVMVRAMLHDLEEEITPESVPAEEVRADFEAQAEALQIPERRSSWHIVVEDSTDAGRALAKSIQAEVKQADDPREVFDRYASGDPGEHELRVKAEELPPISDKAGIEQPYKDALFAARATGPLQKLVETSYGWHVIVLTEVLPEERKTLAEVEDEIRNRLSQKKRFENLVGVVQAGEAAGLVSYDDEGVALLLAMPGLPERVD
jgi:parvulin-like peptidyl-prolyl isomerase